jgi:DNA topoisomerase-1
LAFSVVGLLEQHFPHLVDYEFTARMEDVLDDIANGEAQMVDWLSRFYFGNGDATVGLKKLVSEHIGDIDAREVNSVPIGDGIVVRVGRYGPYVERQGADGSIERGSIPEDLPPDELTLEKAEELLAAPSGDKVLGTDPDTGHEIVARNGRYGPYIQKEKESRSLESEEQLFTIDLPGALALLAQPRQRRGQRAAPTKPLRELGTDPVGGKEIVLKEGRFGPYVTDGETNASLRKGDDPETVTLDRAVELLAERRAKGPAKRGGRRRKAS